MTQTTAPKKNTLIEASNAIEVLTSFIGKSQLYTIVHSFSGEEKQYFFDLAVQLADLVSTMPETYAQDGKGDQAVAYLHYFRGGMDWYITERDCDPEGTGQIQAFGLANLGYGAELGYICIPELLEAGIELDFHFSPCTLAEIKAKAA